MFELLLTILMCFPMHTCRPVEAFIEQLNDEIHVLVPQDQNSVFFFSAYALLVRNSPESQVHNAR
jgi:hypothetical protein